MNTIYFSLLCSVIFFTASSCAGPKGEVGPQGSPGADYKFENRWTSREGYFKGGVEGHMEDGTPYSYNFDFQGNRESHDNYYSIINSSTTSITIKKVFSGEGDTLIRGAIEFTFRVNSLQDLENPQLTGGLVNWMKDIGNNKIHQGEFPFSNTDGSISNLNYDASTGIISGNISLSVSGNTLRNVEIKNGAFSSKLHFPLR